MQQSFPDFFLRIPALLWFIGFAFTPSICFANDTLKITKTQGFIIDGYGTNPAWTQTDWITVTQRSQMEFPKETRAKILYSDLGIYYLFDCKDDLLTSTYRHDFSDLWKEDVVEIFLWPDTNHTIYFEYELSPKNVELPIIIPNINNKFLGWRPWKYTGDRKVIHQTSVQMKTTKDGASIEGWVAEFFIPFKLLNPLVSEKPLEGQLWRGNFYRIDHDLESAAHWSWQPVSKNFHEFHAFGYLLFQ